MIAPTLPLGRAPDRDMFEDPFTNSSTVLHSVNSTAHVLFRCTPLSNQNMQTVEEIRLEWLNILIERHGTLAALNEALDRPRTDGTLSQIKTKAPNTRSGAVRNMGTPLAREIEERLGLERGTLDNPPKTAQATTSAINQEQAPYNVKVFTLPTDSPLKAELASLIDKINDRGLILLIEQAEQIAGRFPKVQANHAS